MLFCEELSAHTLRRGAATDAMDVLSIIRRRTKERRISKGGTHRVPEQFVVFGNKVLVLGPL